MKRPADEPDYAFDSPSKRARMSAPLKSHYRQAGDLLLPANPQDPAVLDGLIDRALAVTLHNAGFDAVNKKALQSLRNIFDEYITRLTHLTRVSLKSGRRSKVQPQDLAFALQHNGIRLDDLTVDLDAQPRPRSTTVRRTTQPALTASNRSSSTAGHFAFPGSLELSRQLGGTADQASRRWIPRHFPSFPPPHTYKATSIPLSTREMDARKVRERATEEGVLAERALRKLVGARQKIGSRPGSRVGSQPGTSAGMLGRADTNRKVGMESAFNEAMSGIFVEDKVKGRESLQHEDEMLFFDGTAEAKPKSPEMTAEGEVEDVAFGAVVNWDRGNWRSGGRDVIST